MKLLGLFIRTKHRLLRPSVAEILPPLEPSVCCQQTSTVSKTGRLVGSFHQLAIPCLSAEALSWCEVNHTDAICTSNLFEVVRPLSYRPEPEFPASINGVELEVRLEREGEVIRLWQYDAIDHR